MKYLILILSISLCACNTSMEQERSLENQIKEAALDPVYYNYQMIIVDHSNNITGQVYDLTLIEERLKSLGHPDICQNPKKVLTDIRGGDEYQELFCKRIYLMRKLKVKYPDVFNGNGDKTIGERVYQYFIENSKEFVTEQIRRNNLTIEKRQKNENK